ncbi:transposase [Streptomyces sp. NPDC001601]|uniref:transposase n=1 Tax=Streptomyces sp. NPDC001601 TaxID=3364592 RepID=UPI0036AD5933
MRFDRSAAWCHRRCFETRSGIIRAGLTLRPAHEARLQTALSKFSRATTPEELFTGQWQSRATELDAYKFCLDQRWQEGCTHAWRLREEIREQLPEWIESARASTDLPSLSRFAQHLERDLDAVVADLSQPWYSGVVEGHVNRIKMLRRQTFGRARFVLLRKRVLLA